MSRIRIEGLLAAFPKLVGTGKQHTYVETDNVRYVYQPIDILYLLLVTNKQSNILEDLDTLRLLSKVVPEYSSSLDEERICRNGFELIFAFNEVISLGHKENITVAQIRQYCEMESHEEKLQKELLQNKIKETKEHMSPRRVKMVKTRGEKGGFLSGRMDSGFGSDMSISSGGGGFASAPGFGLNTDIDSISGQSKGCQSAPVGKTQKTNQFLESLKAEGEVIVEDVRPTAVATQPAAPPLTDPVTLTPEEKLNVVLKKDGGLSNYVLQGTLPLQILNQDDGFIQVQLIAGPLYLEISGNETYVNIEYDASSMFDLQNVVISVPLPALKEAPNVTQIKGEWRYDSRHPVLEWSILLDDSNRRSAVTFRSGLR